MRVFVAVRKIIFLLLASLAARPVGAGEFELRRTNDLYFLDARDAALSDILAEIGRYESAGLKFATVDTRRVTVKTRQATLDKLLDRLEVNYVLTYAPRPEGGFRLDDARLLGHEFSELAPELRSRFLAAIENLRDDDVPYNALRAQAELCEVGCQALPVLEKALWSDDYQTRHVAAWILRHCCTDYEPTPRLLDITADQLNWFEYPEDMYWLTTPSDAYHWLRDSTQAVQQIKGRLIRNLQSDDRQERVLSALLLAEHGETSWSSVLAPILIPHLADNNIPSDGGLAAYALGKLGESARVYITPLLQSEDAQQADLARLILHELDHPGDTNAVLSDFFFNTMISNPVRERGYMKGGYWTDEEFSSDGEGEEEEDVAAEEEPSAPFHYTSRPGETLDDIARMFAVSLNELADLNGFPADAAYQPGTGTILAVPITFE